MFPIDSLTDEHVVPLSLGGTDKLLLRDAACRDCNSNKLNRWDVFLADKLTPTSMARAELDLRGHSGTQPRMEVTGLDPALGDIPMIMQRGEHGTEIVPKVSPLGQGGRLWVTPATSMDEAIKMIGRFRKRPIGREEIGEWGYVRADKFQVKKPDWITGHRAVAKLFYTYLLLELGEAILSAPPMDQLRRYFVEDREEIQPLVEVAEMFNVPAHHHVLTFDSMDPSWNAVCLFRVFWFKFPIDLSSLPQSGRFIALNTDDRTIVEPLTKWRGSWHPRTSIRWGWNR
jgi:hypothetical protein